MRASRIALAVCVAAAFAFAGCTSSSNSDDSTPQACTLAPLGAACSTGGQCCSSNCQNSICVKPVGECGQTDVAACLDPSDCCAGACNGTCKAPGSCGKAVGASCTDPSECCTNRCEGEVGAKVCTDGTGKCKAFGVACTSAGECCEGVCGDGPVLSSGNECMPPTITCKDVGTCTSDAECCGGVGSCVSGYCKPSLDLCRDPSEPCSPSDPVRCCSQICRADGSCSSNVCKQDGQACSDAKQCCSGVCTGSVCQPLPPGPTGATCTTLGEACAANYECCSTYCQGASGGLKNGTCKPPGPCNAKGDICYVAKDCCSGLCAPPAVAGQPGRCDDAPGGCGQDGYPCASDSNCCNKKCVDHGTGAKVCEETDSCRMNGDYCDDTAACCNVNYLVQQSQWVKCDSRYHVCDNGGACNPPGDVCGYKASQDCCFGKKTVCKPDSNNVMRCFGGCPEDSNSPCCKDGHTGWDKDDPLCCIPVGTGTDSICQFSDQCCGGAPCVFDTTRNNWYCTAPKSCLAQGARCSTDAAPSPATLGTLHPEPPADPCCTGSSCRWIGNEIGWACTTAVTPPPSCTRNVGQTCGTSIGCCAIGTCQNGVCKACKDNGAACTSNAECCSAAGGGSCDPTAHVCVPACIPKDGACSVTSNCCLGLTCAKANATDTSGICKDDTDPGPQCAQTGQVCATDGDCCNRTTTGELCLEGHCGLPTCSETNQYCTETGGQCCSGLSCYAQTSGGVRVTCGDASGVGACFCDAPTCIEPPGDCSSIVPCCGSAYCANKSNLQTSCTSNDITQHSCTCRTIG